MSQLTELIPCKKNTHPHIETFFTKNNTVVHPTFVVPQETLTNFTLIYLK